MFPWLLIAVVIVAALINRQTTKGQVSVAHEHPGLAGWWLWLLVGVHIYAAIAEV